MDSHTHEAMVARIEALERKARGSRAVSALLGTLLLAVTLGAWITPERQEVLRVRGLVIVDERGRERVVLGAPVPNPKGEQRNSPGAGMVINDTAGEERFGLTLQENGRMSMGFDAAPGSGDPRNPERLNLGVGPDGSGYLRFLDRRTGLAGYLGLRQDDRVWLEFAEVTADSIIRRRMGLRGEELLREAR
jgi:hypothetical protein